MKRTKTEQHLLNHLWIHDHVTLRGKRELNAAKKLERKNFVEILERTIGGHEARLTRNGEAELNVERMVNEMYPATSGNPQYY